ncbi:molecular chaperone DnaJ [Echinicola sp. 20G]|uniref:molecular chaperone DnaJ n=1 Tax=Echinicola sp. 20G TaxID=2781961 RepID=UPI001F2A3A7E|nr:molecular chaperone DnaJ [Echinicola sp. 20G]
MGKFPILNKTIKLSFVLLLFMASSALKAQNSPNLGQTSKLMELAKSSIEKEDYERANQYFRQIIDSGVPIPSEMPYYFAETLFQLKQYDNSSNFLHKYLEINGFQADHYEEAKGLEKRLEAPLKAIKDCDLCDHRGYRYHTCFTCEGKKVLEQDCQYCRGKGIVGCSRCQGSGLVTKKNIFNITEYFQCARCKGQGRLTCPKCKGSLKEISACKTCSGFGQLHSDELCDHKEKEPNPAKEEKEPEIENNLF